MTKNKALKKQEEHFDFSDMIGASFEADTVTSIMGNLIAASNHQMNVALELTKFIVEKNSSADMNERDILSSFKRVSEAVAENFPIKGLWEKLNT